MRFKYNHGGETYELAVAETKLTSPTGVVRHNGANNYVPFVNPADKNASHLRVRHNGIIRAPIRYFDEPIDMLNGRTLADVKAIFQSGLGKYYFKAGDYFDITIPTAVTLTSGSIPADSTWRVVCLGINHNAELEGHNRGHFCIGRNTDNVEIAFAAQRMNAERTNAGGWAATEMRSFLNSTFYNALPDDLKAVITPCTKYTDNVGGSNIIAENITATVDNIWLLSRLEVVGGGNIAEEKNFAQHYAYYKNGNSRVRYRHDNTSTAIEWRLRSPSFSGGYQFHRIQAEGSTGNISAYSSIGFAPCFTIA